MKYDLPDHLSCFIVDQDYERYTPVDHAVWRYSLRQLKHFLAKNAHSCYLEGLEKTGLDGEKIPRIAHMSECLEKFGWRALPVSGFIPPAAFMELQSLGYLPIASDIRSLDHILYTPAPDIIHEAAGHAPILVHPEFAQYLKNYAQVSTKAIISSEDMALYEAIRVLSDIKEDSRSTPEEIDAAEKKLEQTAQSMTHDSEATWLSRMNWWTAEYGLIGSLENPKIYGAGLLSSVGEAQSCLSSDVKKIPFSIECIDYTYDITEPQPQLFVTPDFATLNKVLEELADRMAFRKGGLEGLRRLHLAQTVNTVELDTGLQISGRLTAYEWEDEKHRPEFLKFDGPTQLSLQGRQLEAHGPSYHNHGYSTPLGSLKDGFCLEKASKESLKAKGFEPGKTVSLEFASGFVVKGDLNSWLFEGDHPLIFSFQNCTVTKGDQIYFQPEWGTFDMAVGQGIKSCFGGPADREPYGQTENFVKKTVPTPSYTELDKERFALYDKVASLRAAKKIEPSEKQISEILDICDKKFPQEWLLYLEIYELGSRLPQQSDWLRHAKKQLQRIQSTDETLKRKIKDGLSIACLDHEKLGRRF